MRSKIPPTIGRTVHYGSHRSEADLKPVAAIITEVHDGDDHDCVTLTVFHPMNEPGFAYMVPFSETLARGCWTWPPPAASR